METVTVVDEPTTVDILQAPRIILEQTRGIQDVLRIQVNLYVSSVGNQATFNETAHMRDLRGDARILRIPRILRILRIPRKSRTCHAKRVPPILRNLVCNG